MIIREWARWYLLDQGLTGYQVEQVLESVKEADVSAHVKWGDDVEGYPPVAKAALAYILDKAILTTNLMP